MEFDPTSRLRCPPEVLSRVLDGEAVLLHLGSGTYFGMNEVASRAWELIQKAPTVAELMSQLLEEFEVEEGQLGRDIDEFVAKLLEAKLVVIEPGPT
jgi:hypothetical protein